MNIFCPHCHSSTIRKNGSIHTGKQKYECLSCHKQFVEDPQNKIIPDDIYNMRKKIFPLNTPTSKEMFWLRTTFEKYFPHDECVKTVPFYKSIACSTDYALEWDDSFKNNIDDSGRAVLGIHKHGRQLAGVL